MFATALAAIFALLLLLVVVRGHASPVRHADDARAAMRAVDLEAFRNLTDIDQERYLRSQLPARAFRRVQRARFMATAEYLWLVAQNAAVLMRLGETARENPDAAVAQLGSQLASSAMSVRIYSLAALVQVFVAILLPLHAPSLGSIADSYDRLTFRYSNLAQMWNLSRVPAA